MNKLLTPTKPTTAVPHHHGLGVGMVLIAVQTGDEVGRGEGFENVMPVGLGKTNWLCAAPQGADCDCPPMYVVCVGVWFVG